MEQAIMKKIAFICIIIVLVYLVVSTGFRLIGGSFTSKGEKISLTDIEEVEVNIEMGVGQMIVNSGATDLVEGTFLYNKKVGEPTMSFRKNKKRGILTISQKERQKGLNIFNKNHEQMTLTLNKEIPMYLNMRTGVGQSDLHLSELNLRDLRIQTGVGETNIYLNGDWKESFHIDIRTGIGRTKIILPKDIGVRLEANRGIGSLSVRDLIQDGNDYYNSAYETSDVTINVTVNMGIGEVIIFSE